MTDVYQSVSTTDEVEDKYAKNEVARKAILGSPLSLVIKGVGFDETYSLFKKETRSRCIAWITTPLCIVGIVFLVMNVADKLHNIERVLSWHWGEMFTLTFLAVQSLAAAAFIMSRTRSLFFLSYYDAWMECAKLEEKKDNGEAECAVSPRTPRSSLSRHLLVALCFFFFTAATVASSAKYALNHGYNARANETATSPLLDKLHSLEPLTSLWAAIVTATAISIYGVLHGIMTDTIDDFNKDLKAASESSSLSTRLDYFAERYQNILIFARVLSSNMGTFATFGTKTSVVANFAAMFLSMAFKEEMGPLANVCVILWTIIAIAAMVVILLQPAAVQQKLNDTNEILLADKTIWRGDITVSQQAQMMVNRRRYTDTTVSIFKCLKLTPWVANGVMVVPPIIGGALICLKLFVVKS